MTGQLHTLQIQESPMNGWLRLSLAGELDLASTPLLEDRLARLRALKDPVRLDLSNLHFIDSTGLQLLIRELGEARAKHWELGIERDLLPHVRGLLRLVRMEHVLLDREVDAAPAAQDQPGTSPPSAPA